MLTFASDASRGVVGNGLMLPNCADECVLDCGEVPVAGEFVRGLDPPEEVALGDVVRCILMGDCIPGSNVLACSNRSPS